ncbi:hypothetical protein C8R42DRAFT_681642 [Lentinula raphanica]|nr:hypothetical protein C8R42DRAFT_681642 [Lentinula raphanica]
MPRYIDSRASASSRDNALLVTTPDMEFFMLPFPTVKHACGERTTLPKTTRSTGLNLAVSMVVFLVHLSSIPRRRIHERFNTAFVSRFTRMNILARSFTVSIPPPSPPSTPAQPASRQPCILERYASNCFALGRYASGVLGAVQNQLLDGWSCSSYIDAAFRFQRRSITRYNRDLDRKQQSSGPSFLLSTTMTSHLYELVRFHWPIIIRGLFQRCIRDPLQYRITYLEMTQSTHG